MRKKICILLFCSLPVFLLCSCNNKQIQKKGFLNTNTTQEKELKITVYNADMDISVAKDVIDNNYWGIIFNLYEERNANEIAIRIEGWEIKKFPGDVKSISLKQTNASDITLPASFHFSNVEWIRTYPSESNSMEGELKPYLIEGYHIALKPFKDKNDFFGLQAYVITPKGDTVANAKTFDINPRPPYPPHN